MLTCCPEIGEDGTVLGTVHSIGSPHGALLADPPLNYVPYFSLLRFNTFWLGEK